MTHRGHRGAQPPAVPVRPATHHTFPKPLASRKTRSDSEGSVPRTWCLWASLAPPRPPDPVGWQSPAHCGWTGVGAAVGYSEPGVPVGWLLGRSLGRGHWGQHRELLWVWQQAWRKTDCPRGWQAGVKASKVGSAGALPVPIAAGKQAKLLKLNILQGRHTK